VGRGGWGGGRGAWDVEISLTRERGAWGVGRGDQLDAVRLARSCHLGAGQPGIRLGRERGTWGVGISLTRERGAWGVGRGDQLDA
jgi:hypothetical protein